MAENAIPAAVSEELYTTQDLLSEDPVAATKTLTEVHHELDVDEDRDVVEDETYETDEELLAESKNVKPLEENNEQAGDEGLEPMEEGLESSTETDAAPGIKAKPKVSLQNRISELPLAKIKHIIKLDPEVNLVNSEAVYLVTRATEHFIRSLAKEAYNHTAQQKKKTLTKSHVDQALAMLPIEL